MWRIRISYLGDTLFSDTIESLSGLSVKAVMATKIISIIKVIVCNVGITRTNHPFGNDLY